MKKACLHCGSYANITEGRKPQEKAVPGAVLLCAYCLQGMVVYLAEDGELEIRLPTDDETEEIDENSDVKTARQALMAMPNVRMALSMWRRAGLS